MNNPPAFQFYPQDFLADINVQSMSMEERGIYITLLCHCWIEGGIPSDSRVVKGWLNDGSILVKCFYEKDGKYRNKRLDLEREKQIQWREKSAKGGRKGGKNKRLIKGGSRVVQPPLKPSSSSSSSSSSSNKDHKNDLIKVGKSDPLFEALWKQWPEEGRFKKKHCRMKFEALCKQGQLAEFQRTTQGYSDYLKDKVTKDNFNQQPMHLATWLNNWEGDKERYINYEYTPKM